MTKEQMHIELCNSFKTQILAIAISVNDLDAKRDFIFSTTTYDTVIHNLECATKCLDEIIESLAGDEEEDEGVMF